MRLSRTSGLATTGLMLAALASGNGSGCIIEKRSAELAAKPITRVVNTLKPSREEFSDLVAFIGFVEPRKLISVHFLVPGRVSTCRIKEGEQVSEGDEICLLDTSAVNLEVARSLNAVKATERVLETNLPEKQKALFEAGVIGQAEFEHVRVQSENAKAQYSDARSVYEMALKKQREHRLLAPWDGTVSKLLAKPGQPIAPELPAAIVSDERGLQVKTELHASYFKKLRIGSQAKLQAISSRRLAAQIALRVIDRSSIINPNTQTFQVMLGLVHAADQEKLASGIIVSGQIELERLTDALVIHESSLNTWNQNGQASVYVVDFDGTLRLKEIETGAIHGGRVEVRKGLSEADLVVTEIAPDFVNGMNVEVSSAIAR